MATSFKTSRSILLIVVTVLGGCAAPQTRTPQVDAAAARNAGFEQKKLVVRTQVDEMNRLARVA